ncbi:MAG TPA: Rne/Rng family ribonuclease [Terriglobia bacterium]|nr:Rne/Rng family ribonuclease [Terriglobia bacterium]
MPKELFISSSPHETKVAVLEDDALVEVFFQRDTDVGLVGGIYKGRVSRVLPGMQSAFVDIGLERDAFLYVSDFFEDSDEYDRVTAEVETRVGKFAGVEPRPLAETEPAAATPPESTATSGQTGLASSETPPPSAADETAAGDPITAAPHPAEPVPETAASSVEGQSQQTRRPWHETRGRGRRRRRGRGFEGRQGFRESHAAQVTPAAAAASTFEVLPGESLARHGQGAHEPSPEDLHPDDTLAVTTHETSDTAPSGIAQDAIASEQAIPVLGAVPVLESPYPAPQAPAAKEPAEPLESEPASIAIETTGVAEIERSAEFTEEGFEEELLAGNLRVAPVSVEPDAPSHYRSEAAVSNAPETPSVEPGGNFQVSDTAETSAAEEPTTSDLTAALGEAAGTEDENDDDEEVAYLGEVAATMESTGVAGQEAEASGEKTPGAEAPGDTAERSYTLRERSQRPRFAPRRGRRGRGRFNRGPRPEGGGRRPEQPRGSNEQAVQINEVLKEGQEILVQIAKEPLGTKGARITSHVALPGRYLVYMPTIHHIGVSRKIGSEEERLRLRNIILEHRGSLTGGIIVRTAAAGRSEEELKADVEFLARLWNEIRTRSEQSRAPALIHRDLTLVERILRDVLSPDFKCLRLDNETVYQNVLDFVHRFQPTLVGQVKLYTKETPMFEEFGIQAEIDKALKPKVWLKSGGYIVINQTEALVAIDVNTGKYVGKTNRLEDTIVKTNIDAVKEIVRQVRLRDLGGIIVIDFIDMDDRRNRMKVVQALEEALRSDRAPTKILSFNEFGLVALTRKRVKQSLERTLSEQCPYCAGSGWVKSAATVSYEIMEEVKKMAHEMEGNVVTLRVNPEVARILRSREGMLMAEIEKLTGKDVVIKSDSGVHQERFEIF